MKAFAALYDACGDTPLSGFVVVALLQVDRRWLQAQSATTKN